MRQCKHCPRQTLSTDPVAWHLGWRWFNGTTQGGQELQDVLCPGCHRGQTSTWNVECRTCWWAFSSDDFEPGAVPLATARDAVPLAREHRCEPDMWIFDPDGNGKALDAYDRDGNLRKP
jgi:hypothetical protein